MTQQRFTLLVRSRKVESDWIDLTAGPDAVEAAVAAAAADSEWEVARTENAHIPPFVTIDYLRQYSRLLQMYDNQLVHAVVNVCLGDLDEAEEAIERMFPKERP